MTTDNSRATKQHKRNDYWPYKQARLTAATHEHRPHNANNHREARPPRARLTDRPTARLRGKRG